MARIIRPRFPDGEIHLTIVFHPPDNRRRDLDNLLASIKAGLDALAISWGVDDTRFIFTVRRGQTIKHGAVTVEVQTL